LDRDTGRVSPRRKDADAGGEDELVERGIGGDGEVFYYTDANGVEKERGRGTERRVIVVEEVG